MKFVHWILQTISRITYSLFIESGCNSICIHSALVDAFTFYDVKLVVVGINSMDGCNGIRKTGIRTIYTYTDFESLKYGKSDLQIVRGS